MTEFETITAQMTTRMVAAFNKGAITRRQLDRQATTLDERLGMGYYSSGADTANARAKLVAVRNARRVLFPSLSA